MDLWHIAPGFMGCCAAARRPDWLDFGSPNPLLECVKNSDSYSLVLIYRKAFRAAVGWASRSRDSPIRPLYVG